MNTFSQTEKTRSKKAFESGFGFDTTFVLFFLAVEFGQIFRNELTIDGVFLALTLVSIIVLPYFLINSEKPIFAKWLLGRALIASFAALLGWMFKQSLGIVLPETFRFLPMTLLIVTAMISCYAQFYGFLRLRFVK